MRRTGMPSSLQVVLRDWSGGRQTVHSGVAHKKDQGRTPGGRAGLSNARTALRCAGRPRPPRQRVDQHLARRASQSIERCGI
eukprot:scaffold10151_cov84-Phaeocystis_antarctica.AAC.1